ncbi:hypothetical protein Bbelb_164850 [Branchiostoma belcheri]|nr:hypothetical protein Bbelb_164850 [Branchiostoma belcheri]
MAVPITQERIPVVTYQVFSTKDRFACVRMVFSTKDRFTCVWMVFSTKDRFTCVRKVFSTKDRFACVGKTRSGVCTCPCRCVLRVGCLFWEKPVDLKMQKEMKTVGTVVTHLLVSLCLQLVDPKTGLQQEEEPDFCRQGCMKEDGEV